MSPMSSDSETKVRTAKELLRGQLESLFAETSAECRKKLSRLDYEDSNGYWIPGDATEEGIGVIQDGIDRWREESLRRIASVFTSLYPVTCEGQRDAVGSLFDTEKLVWEAVDEVFKWTTDKNSLLKFEEWESRVTGTPTEIFGGAAPLNKIPYIRAGEFSLVSPECNQPDADLADQLNCDFRTQFEHRLTVLRNEAILTSLGTSSTTNEVASTEMPTKTDEMASTATPAEKNTGENHFADGGGVPRELLPFERRNAEISRLVTTLMHDIKKIRGFGDSSLLTNDDLQEYKRRDPNCHIFDVKLTGYDSKVTNYNILYHLKSKSTARETAAEIVAGITGLAPDTVDDYSRRYRYLIKYL